jgi:hypothetical protein
VCQDKLPCLLFLNARMSAYLLKWDCARSSINCVLSHRLHSCLLQEMSKQGNITRCTRLRTSKRPLTSLVSNRVPSSKCSRIHPAEVVIPKASIVCGEAASRMLHRHHRKCRSWCVSPRAWFPRRLKFASMIRLPHMFSVR